MQQTIYMFLRQMLLNACIQAFPDSYSLHNQITFSSITPDASVDIATPFLFTISKFYQIELDTIRDKIVPHLEWNTSYLRNNKLHVYKNGFLNFQLSSPYIFYSVYHVAVSTLYKDICLSDKKDSNGIVQSLQKLTERNDLLQVIEPYSSLNWTLLYSIEEQQLMRTICISEPSALHSKNAIHYFKNRLIREVVQFYYKHSIITRNADLTSMRLLLITSLCNRLRSLNK